VNRAFIDLVEAAEVARQRPQGPQSGPVDGPNDRSGSRYGRWVMPASAQYHGDERIRDLGKEKVAAAMPPRVRAERASS
jgi:hypothetical protein